MNFTPSNPAEVLGSALMQRWFRVFQSATGRQPLRDACQPHGFAAQQIGEVVCGRFTFDVRAQREDDFDIVRPIIDAAQQRGNPEVFRRNAVERGEFPAEAVIASTKRAGALDRQHVGGLLDDAKLVRVSG